MLQVIIRGHVDAGTVIRLDNWLGFNGLVDIGFDKYFTVLHGKNELANGEPHIIGSESFRISSKRRLTKLNELAKTCFFAGETN